MRRLFARVFAFYWGEGIADDVPALTYYLVLSLAPFALGLAALEALLLKDVLSALQVVDQLNRFLPETLHDDIRRLVLGTRDDSPLLLAVAIGAMLWTTSGAIGVIERCLARITSGPRHHIVVGRLRNIVLGGLVAVAVILASLSISVVSDFSYKLRAGSGLPGPTILVFNTLGSILVFAAIYRYAPLARISWRSALKGARAGGHRDPGGAGDRRPLRQRGRGLRRGAGVPAAGDRAARAVHRGDGDARRRRARGMLERDQLAR